jgi:release factor glutamine methyltransferase
MRATPACDSDRTVGAALALAVARLDAAGVETARLDARLLLAAAIGATIERTVAWPERLLTGPEAKSFAALIERRAAREPVAQIIGRREFWSLDLATTRDTLTPRPDSEAVIEAALRLIPDRDTKLRILDLGTGTGCLLLALLSEYAAASGVGTDLSPAAVKIAVQNAATLGFADRISILVSEWDDAVAGRFDLIVSNPPYIRTAELERLDPEVVAFEPRLALDGGVDGLNAYRALAPRLMSRVASGGFAVLEIGADQAADVEEICVAAGLKACGRQFDLAGRERCIVVGR